MLLGGVANRVPLTCVVANFALLTESASMASAVAVATLAVAWNALPLARCAARGVAAFAGDFLMSSLERKACLGMVDGALS